ncbi:4,5-DOPA dioxygenase extradiol [Solitalea sp. MAHUQ-68]|uniref:4,5-DOPA dioxygenase extradiol n=1 Tax=Solitalea agri TaxID=2953739 RepID=A0A9X2JDG7_9SPHI|nr:4,5-DOPA dioxygenase extradiol [Solitalea agri]MCO4291386.1 4,5-DOPA dioxygenase extradiol [Solitalea agri]
MESLRNWAKPFLENNDKLIMPALFVGHGNPMNALSDNEYTRAWSKIGREIEKPKAILVVSAHWLTRGTYVTAMEKPRTIHDFGGFPRQLFEVEYPAPGSPELAEETRSQIKLAQIQLDHEWGLDHGTWSVLIKMFPNADIPVFQLSIDFSKSLQWHYELAKELAFLRSKGVLIMGSGNIVHNLRLVDFHGKGGYDWAEDFDESAKKLLLENKHQELIQFEKLGKEALLSIPTTEHYIPLIYTMALKNENEQVSFPIEGLDLGSISMRSVLFN